MNLQTLYQDLIIDHASSPRNHHVISDASYHSEGFNPLCGDKITLYLKVKNNIIEGISFQGQGCAISTASASLLTEVIKDKTLEEAKLLFLTIQDLFTSDADFPEEFGKLAALAGVRSFPARVKCATLAWHTLHAALKQTTRSNDAKDPSIKANAISLPEIVTTE